MHQASSGDKMEQIRRITASCKASSLYKAHRKSAHPHPCISCIPHVFRMWPDGNDYAVDAPNRRLLPSTGQRLPLRPLQNLYLCLL